MHVYPCGAHARDQQKQQQQQHPGAACSDSGSWGARTPETLTTAPHSPQDRSDNFTSKSPLPLGDRKGVPYRPSEGSSHKRGVLERLELLRLQLTSGIQQQKPQQQHLKGELRPHLLPNLHVTQQISGTADVCSNQKGVNLSDLIAVGSSLTAAAASRATIVPTTETAPTAAVEAAEAEAYAGGHMASPKSVVTPATATNPAAGGTGSNSSSGGCRSNVSNSSSTTVDVRLLLGREGGRRPQNKSAVCEFHSNSNSNSNTDSPLHLASPYSSSKPQTGTAGSCSSSTTSSHYSSTQYTGSLAAAVQQQHQQQHKQRLQGLDIPGLCRGRSSMV